MKCPTPRIRTFDHGQTDQDDRNDRRDRTTFDRDDHFLLNSPCCQDDRRPLLGGIATRHMAS